MALSSLLSVPERATSREASRVDPSVDVVDQIRALLMDAAGLSLAAGLHDSRPPEIKLFTLIPRDKTQPIPPEAVALMPALQGYSFLFSNDVLAIVSPASGLVVKLYWDTCRFANPSADYLSMAQFSRLQDLLKPSSSGSKG